MEITSDQKPDSTVWRPPTPESLFRPVAQPHGRDEDEPVEMLPPPALQGPGQRTSVMSIAALLNLEPHETGEKARAEEEGQGAGTISPLTLQEDEAPAVEEVRPTPANRPVRKAARVSALTLRDLARSAVVGSSTAETSSTPSQGADQEHDELFEEEDDGDEEEEVGARGGRKRKRAVASGSAKKRKTETVKSVDPTRLEATAKTTAATAGGTGQRGKAMDRRTAHSLIERRRREKINACLQRLTVLVPQCRELREEKVAKEGKRKVSGSTGWNTDRTRKAKKKGGRLEEAEEDEEEGCAGVGSGKLHKLEILLGTVEYIEQLENRLAELEPGSSSSSSRSSGATTTSSTRPSDGQAAAAASEDTAALLLLNLASPELAPVR